MGIPRHCKEMAQARRIVTPDDMNSRRPGWLIHWLFGADPTASLQSADL
jgi:hypothetical protein